MRQSTRKDSRVGSVSSESVGALVTVFILAAMTCLRSNKVLTYFPDSTNYVFTAKDVNDVSIFKKQQGDGWEIWNRKTILHDNHPDAKFGCRWEKFTPSTDPNKKIPMCLHPESDLVSNFIAATGRWDDCDELVTLWHKRPDPESNTFYIDVGSNIGACVMEMLFSTDAEIVAFEPSPKNLFCLTSTLSLLDEDMSDRVTLFPIALGAEAGESTINMAMGNYANSVVAEVVKDSPDQEFLAPFAIQVERLDALLNPAYFNAGLMKLDAQGYECYIMDGMPRVLQEVVQVKFGSWERWLSSFEGCSEEILWEDFLNQGFDIYSHTDGLLERLTGDSLEADSNYIAIKRRVSEE